MTIFGEQTMAEAVNSNPARYLWLMGLQRCPYPLPPIQEDPIDPAPGAAQEGTDPAIPPAGEGLPEAAPGAEPLEALPPMPVDATRCGLVSWDGTPCGLDAGHSPFVRHAPASGNATGAGAA